MREVRRLHLPYIPLDPNTVDLIITSGDVSVENLCLQSFPSADHYIISFSFQSVIMCPALPGYVFDYTRAGLDGICSYLMDSDFSFCVMTLSLQLNLLLMMLC